MYCKFFVIRNLDKPSVAYITIWIQFNSIQESRWLLLAIIWITLFCNLNISLSAVHWVMCSCLYFIVILSNSTSTFSVARFFRRMGKCCESHLMCEWWKSEFGSAIMPYFWTEFIGFRTCTVYKIPELRWVWVRLTWKYSEVSGYSFTVETVGFEA